MSRLHSAGAGAARPVAGVLPHLHPLGLLCELDSVDGLLKVRGRGRDAEDHRDEAGGREGVPEHPGQGGRPGAGGVSK